MAQTEQRQALTEPQTEQQTAQQIRRSQTERLLDKADEWGPLWVLIYIQFATIIFILSGAWKWFVHRGHNRRHEDKPD